MGIGRQRLYKDDEISASEIAGRRRRTGAPMSEYRAQAVVKFLGECRWQKPPSKDWVKEQDRSLTATATGSFVGAMTLIRNRPVPRVANCHYAGVKSLALTTDSSTFYFY